MKLHIYLITSLFIFTLSCGEGNDINLFSVSDDKQLGSDLDQQIENDPQNYPLLDESDYPDAYAYLRGIRDKILQSDDVNLKDEFEWEIHIIQDDNTLNAFAAPGGYIYFYTGLIKFLDEEDYLAGVLGHEIAHAANRHSTDALTRQFGIATLINVVLGENQNILSDMAAGLTSLAFSRNAESEADTYSVFYLADTEYSCAGAAGFFEKIQSVGGQEPPEFLSTHPSSEDRVQAIYNQAEQTGCSTELSGNNYQAFLNMLP